jgi:hypothetical protein
VTSRLGHTVVVRYREALVVTHGGERILAPNQQLSVFFGHPPLAIAGEERCLLNDIAVRVESLALGDVAVVAEDTIGAADVSQADAVVNSPAHSQYSRYTLGTFLHSRCDAEPAVLETVGAPLALWGQRVPILSFDPPNALPEIWVAEKSRAARRHSFALSGSAAYTLRPSTGRIDS